MRIATGIPGLDHILRGGLLPGRVYLLHGATGTGKTTVGLHILAAGKTANERGLLITFGETEDNIRADARALGLNLDGVAFLDLTPAPETFSAMQTYDIFSPAEVEREPMTEQISEAIQDAKPQRIFLDGFGHFRNLASDPFHHRRLAQSFFRYATQHGATLVVASDERECERDVDGIVQLDCSPEGRTIRITKFRGSDFQAGYYPMRLTGTGVQVAPGAA